jgi:hypothetical protein
MKSINFGRVLLGRHRRRIDSQHRRVVLNDIILGPHIEADMKRMGITPPGLGSPRWRTLTLSSASLQSCFMR